MNLIKTIHFETNNEKYEVRIYHDLKLINFVVFKKNYPATGIRHQIMISKDKDVEKRLNQDSINYFVELSKKEISDNIWGKIIN